MTHTLQQLSHRLDVLERENRWLKLGTCAMAVLLAGGAAAAAGAVPILGNRFTLVDAQQHPRVVLDTSSAGAQRGNPMLTFYDWDSTVRIRIGIGERGAVLEVVEPNGHVRSLLPAPLPPGALIPR